MMNHETKRSRAGVFAGVLAALALTVAGVAVSSDGGAEATEPVSVCETGFTSDPQYRAECMSVGGTQEAADLWFVGYSAEERDAQCADAWRVGGMRTLIVETRGDLIGDAHTNYDDMIDRVSMIAVTECVINGHDSDDVWGQ